MDRPEQPQTYDFTVIVVDHQNSPVSKAVVEIFSAASEDNAISSQKTDSKGKVTFSALEEGKYRITAKSGEFSSVISVAVTSDQESNHAQIKFKAPQPKFCDFKVVVKSHKSAILPERKVDLMSVDGKVLQSLVTDNAGTAFFKKLDPGKYKVLVYNALGEKMDESLTDITVGTNTLKNKAEIKVTAYLQNADIIIIGAMLDPQGVDSPSDGQITQEGPFRFEHTLGGYEYIQLMALKDLNFAEFPYAVVTTLCDDSDEAYGSNGEGWVESASVNNGAKHYLNTYQMNLTHGTVKKGEIFYVGGNSRAIAGYNVRGWYSNQIEEHRWFGFDYYNDKADNKNGQPRGAAGLLGNLNADGKTNIPDGIAVFGTINVDVSSVPQDVIFYGGESQLRTVDKFRVTNNDHYSVIDEDGTPQPYFGQGTNTWFAKQKFHDEGCFIRMGGVFYNGEWVTPRTAEAVKLNVQRGKDAVTVDDIEKAEGVTKVIFK